ncbi:MAG: hypothetical protein IJN47_06025, partial [Clostridia bacterium]|nr:hypothetical protein [Clostridia bacterium]
GGGSLLGSLVNLLGDDTPAQTQAATSTGKKKKTTSGKTSTAKKPAASAKTSTAKRPASAAKKPASGKKTGK